MSDEDVLGMVNGVRVVKPTKAAVYATVMLVQRVGAQLKVTLLTSTSVPIKKIKRMNIPFGGYHHG